MPFGPTTEALDAYAGRQPRHGHAGRRTTSATRSSTRTTSRSRRRRRARCHVRLPDAACTRARTRPTRSRTTSHELLYALRCTDGTEIITNIVSRFGDAGRVHARVRPGAHGHHARQRLPGRPGRPADPRPRVHRVRLPRPSRPHHVGLGRLRDVDAENELRTHGTACSRPTTRLRRLQPVPLRRSRRPRSAARSTCAARPSRTATAPTARACDDALARHRRLRRPALAVRRHPPRHLPARHDPHQRGRPAPAGGPTRTATTPPRAIPGRHLPARRPPSTPPRYASSNRSSAATAPTTPRESTPRTEHKGAWPL